MPQPDPIGKLTTAEVAERLGVTRARVLALIRADRLPTVRIGPLHLINPADLERVKVRKPGRPWPKKPKPAAKRGTAGVTPAARSEQADAALRETVKRAGVPMGKAKRGKRM